MAEAIEKTQKTQWHPAFVGGIKISLLDYSDELTYDPEYQLTKGPLYTDILVIRKNTGGMIDNDIARIFRNHNLIEYKSPDDALNIDDFYKVLAYVGLYKAAGATVNEIPGDGLTATLIREGKPVSLFKEIRRLGGTVKESAKGVYQVEGMANFPVQVVVTRDLEGDTFASLRVLSKKPSEDDIRTFVTQAMGFQKQGDKQDADAVLQVSISANEKVYEEIKRRDPVMCDALMTLMKPEMEAEFDIRVKRMQEESNKREEASMLNNIKNLMETLALTAQQAMDALKIPAKDQGKYSAML